MPEKSKTTCPPDPELAATDTELEKLAVPHCRARQVVIAAMRDHIAAGKRTAFQPDPEEPPVQTSEWELLSDSELIQCCFDVIGPEWAAIGREVLALRTSNLRMDAIGVLEYRLVEKLSAEGIPGWKIWNLKQKAIGEWLQLSRTELVELVVESDHRA